MHWSAIGPHKCPDESEHPNDLWLSDVTYVPTREGWLYLAAVLKAYSRPWWAGR